MTESIFSPSWYRVADLRPRLRRHVQIHRHHYRGQLWYVIQDSVTGRNHRLTPAGHYIIGLLDGQRSVQEVWELATEQLGDEAPTQEEMIRLLGQLHGSDLLLCDVSPDSRELFRRYQRQQRSRWKQRLRSPLSLRFPLFDPESLLNRGLPLMRPLFGWLGGLVWLVVVSMALVLAAVHWPELSDNMLDRVLAPQNLLLLWLLYPLVKALHEFGHAFATKVWGGEVHEMGIMLLVLIPVPYVDASAATAFHDKRKRMAVGAAGMMVELFVAALALLVWLNVEPGLVRLIAYNVMLIGGISTLFFNANPLLRFDGYYILADAIEIQNLATRSNQYLGYLILRFLFGVPDARSTATTSGERAWFVGYGIASFSYRILITCVIILFVGEQFFVVGVVLAVWATLGMVVAPLVKHIAFLFTSPQLRRSRFRAITSSGLVLAALTVLLFSLPVPLWTRAEGVVWLPEQAQVHAGTDGMVSRLLVDPNTVVRQGAPLIELEDPLLPARVELLEARLRELSARYTTHRRSDRVEAQILKKEMAMVEADLARAQERVEALIIRSPTQGVFIVPQAQDLPDRFIRQGELVAYVVDPSTITVRAVVPQAAIGLVRQRTEEVEVKLFERVATTQPAVIQREVPAATDQLPSAALGSAGGGRIATDPSDPEGLRALDTVFQFDLRLREPTAVTRVGGRVYVRFDHGVEPLAQQWYRLLRQLFLRRFGV